MAGPGTLSLQAANTYTGATVVSGGTLRLSGASGALTGTAGVTLNQGGTLALSNTASNNNSGDDAATDTETGPPGNGSQEEKVKRLNG